MDIVPGPPYPGAYRHHKGGIYVVHKIITDQTNNNFSGRLTQGRIVVLYESLGTRELHVRDVAEFLTYVHADGSISWYHHMNSEIESCEECQPRFAPIIQE